MKIIIYILLTVIVLIVLLRALYYSLPVPESPRALWELEEQMKKELANE